MGEHVSQMAQYGKRLVDLHLLKSPELDSTIAKFEAKGDNIVQKLKYERSPSPCGIGRGGRLYINKDQYFDGISSEIWQYQIGGYQICDKWLKDRKGRSLTFYDIKHYRKIVTSIQKTIEMQKAIDKIYPGIEKEIIELKNI
ncbi:MAG: type ISP restriction/modification enzyme [Candidatus Zixiibacteriota bacterium]